jgi:plastocyanin
MRGKVLCAALLAVVMASPGAMASDEVVIVELLEYRFHPAELEVPVGTTVRWVNMERRTSHDIYFPAEDLGSERLFPEESWERRFDEAGTYEYHCRPHEDREMRGMIRVIAKD